jgi:hypothetical protein
MGKNPIINTKLVGYITVLKDVLKDKVRNDDPIVEYRPIVEEKIHYVD